MIIIARDNQADGWSTRAQIQKLLPDSHGTLHWVNHSSACVDTTSTGNTSPNGGTSQQAAADTPNSAALFPSHSSAASAVARHVGGVAMCRQ